MDRGAWWATVHRVVEELDTTKGLNNNNSTMFGNLLFTNVYFPMLTDTYLYPKYFVITWYFNVEIHHD